MLHPVVQYHIVNSLGWKSLRPFQEDVIPEILSGKHMVILAPTAGGKTEAAFFPAVSRILTEQWEGLSVLYVCPLKALLNNLNVRLQHYSRLMGLKSEVWHGDVSSTARGHMLRDHPNCLLTTPESLEVMLLSDRVDHQQFFANLRIVIVDEIHAFAGDDRGWHLLSVLSRITRFAGRELQRIGLSATVGNPEVLSEWLSGTCSGTRAVYAPAFQATSHARVTVDYVGSIKNAAVLISRLHRGEKRLVFIDSRSKVEELGVELKELGVRTFVTHSSLSKENRLAAEEAFASGSDCVIVATSVLELGIDVGDLDRVIQINSPGSVAGFLQRMGRTGRRSGAERNCLFLATTHEALLMISGIVCLWQQGYVDPVIPPQQPLHILAQQIMALALQQRGISRQAVRGWLRDVPPMNDMSQDVLDALFEWMLGENLMWDDHGVLWFGTAGEKNYGKKNFLELFTVFLVPPVFEILHGRQHVGSVDEVVFLAKTQGPRLLMLGATSWQVNHIDWKRRVAYVEPIMVKGRAKWIGSGRRVPAMLARSIRRLLSSDDVMREWSDRAISQMREVREEYGEIRDGQTTLQRQPTGWTWLTFAGTLANMALANALKEQLGEGLQSDALCVSTNTSVPLSQFLSAIESLRGKQPAEILPQIDEQAIAGLKFSDCLSPDLARGLLTSRYADPEAIQQCLAEQVFSLAHDQLNFTADADEVF